MNENIRWPLASNTIRRNSVNNTFGMVRNKGKKAHQGWDFKALNKTPCVAIADGEIALRYIQKDYGLVLVLRFELNERTLYAAYCHLDSVAVGETEKVKKGEVIAYTGKSGNAANQATADEHLHFEIRTHPRPGPSLAGRLDPIEVFSTCPLHEIIADPIDS